MYTLGTLIVLKILIPNPNFPEINLPRGEATIFEHFNQHINHSIAVLPHWNSTETTQEFLKSVNDLWLTMRIDPGKHPIKWIYYKTSEELLASYWRDPTTMPLAIVFNGEDPINGPLKYEVRTNPSFVVTPSTTNLYSSMAACRQSDTSWTSVFPIETGDSCPVNQYYYSGFIALQTLLDYTKIGVSTKMVVCILRFFFKIRHFILALNKK